MTVGFITRDFSGVFPNLIPGGCAYYRSYLPMAVTGHKLIGPPVFDPMQGFGIKDSFTTGIFGFKTVSLKLIMDRWTAKQIELSQNLGQRVFVDVDDYYEGLTPANKAYQLSHPEHNKISNRAHYENVIAAADLITVSTPFLLDYYKSKYPNVVMVRNGVNMQQFTPIKHKNNRPVLGWTGSTEYRNNDLEQLREWLPAFLEEHDLYFHHAGASGNVSFADVTGINPNRLRTSPIVPITEYAAGLKFDIGLVPLNSIPFNEAKSNIKGLEYAAAGIPFIASDLPEYRLLAEDGVGILANTADEWRAAAENLLDRHYRRQYAERGREVVKANWSIEARALEWSGIY
jgi:glycosyltransferase involved in cell wall biosynthesis